jgi:hypothetical protein
VGGRDTGQDGDQQKDEARERIAPTALRVCV